MSETRDVRIDEIEMDAAERPIAAGGCSQEQLRASIAGPMGLLQPIVVKAKPGGGYTIAAGRRRLRAAGALGWETIPARVLPDDASPELVQLAENGLRADFHPLDLADRIAKAHAAGLGYADIATGLGVTPGEVARAERLAGLHPTLKSLAARIEARGEAVPWAKALELARLPEGIQAELMAEYHYGEHGLFGRGMTKLREAIAERCLRISAAPWPEKWVAGELPACSGCPMDPAERPIAAGGCSQPEKWVAGELPACSGCPRRTDAQKLLFSDLADKKGRAEARCLDPTCWQAKKRAWLADASARLKASGCEAVLTSNDYLGDVERARLVKEVGTAWVAKAQFVPRHAAEAAKKSDPDAVQALQIDTGRTVWIKRPAPERADADSRTAGRVAQTVAEKRAALEDNRWRAVLKALAEEIRALDHNGAAEKFGAARLMSLVSLLSQERRIRPDLAAAILHGDAETAEDMLSRCWGALSDELTFHVLSDANKGPLPKPLVALAEEIADRLGHQALDMYNAAADDMPEPKSWAKQEAAEGHAKAVEARRAREATAIAPAPESKPKRGRPRKKSADPLDKLDADMEAEGERIRKELDAASDGTATTPAPVEAWAYTNGEEGMAERIYSVSQGIGDVDGAWFTAWGRSREDSHHRVKSTALANRATAAEAQADLNAYAVAKGLTRCCAVCGCTDDDCAQCIKKTGEPCHWTGPGLCSACADEEEKAGAESE